MSVFFTSDQHFGHENIIKHSRRPFASVGEMDEELIRRWNVVVKPRDEVYVIGDVAPRSRPERVIEIYKRLTGRKYLVFGNHDKKLRKSKAFTDLFVWCKDLADVKVQDAKAPGGVQHIVLCHYAFRVWNKSHYGSWNLHGHSHGSLWDNPKALQLDVGVDCWAYAPVSYEEIRDRMAQKIWVPVDHHGRDR